jgi:MFS family permease
MNETPSPTTATPSNKSALLIVFFVVVVDLLGFGIVLPLLPVTGNEYAKALFPEMEAASRERVSGPIIGLLMASFSLMQFVFAPIWGRVSDRIGRRPVLVVGLVGSVLFYGLFGYAAGISPQENAVFALSLLFLARIGAGIAGATISTAQAVIADSTAPEKRKHGMALIGAAFGIAFTFGPLLGALALYLVQNERLAMSYTGYIASGLSFVALILAATILPETRKADAPGTQRKWFDVGALKLVVATSAIAPVVLTFFLATLGFGAFETTLAMLIRDALEIPKKYTYWFFAYTGFVLMIAQGLIYRRLAKRVSEVTFMVSGIVMMAAGVIGLAGVSYLAYARVDLPGVRLSLMLVAMATAVVGFAFLTPSAQALISRRAPAEKQGEVLGFNQSASAMARILGPIFGLSLYKLTSSHMLPFLFGSLLLLAMLPLIPRIRRGEG